MLFLLPSSRSFASGLDLRLWRALGLDGGNHSSRDIRVRVRRCLVWCLVAALLVYSMSGCLLRVVGPRHWHADGASPAPVASSGAGLDALTQVKRWLSGIRSLSDELHVKAHALGIAPHHHTHSAVLRHWHAQEDNSVRLVVDDAVDPELADLKAAAAMGGATLLMALAPMTAWRVPASPNGGWPVSCASRWRSAELPLPSEPPAV